MLAKDSEKPPPYEENKKCIGYFECSVCPRKWWSSECWPNGAQPCWRCGARVYPKYRRPLIKPIKRKEITPQTTVVFVPDRRPIQHETSCFKCHIL